jgi:hypothetical protein
MLWDNEFSACGGDQPSWEAWPVKIENGAGGVGGLVLHEVILAGWGLPIGMVCSINLLLTVIRRDVQL